MTGSTTKSGLQKFQDKVGAITVALMQAANLTESPITSMMRLKAHVTKETRDVMHNLLLEFVPNEEKPSGCFIDAAITALINSLTNEELLDIERWGASDTPVREAIFVRLRDEGIPETVKLALAGHVAPKSNRNEIAISAMSTLRRLPSNTNKFFVVNQREWNMLVQIYGIQLAPANLPCIPCVVELHFGRTQDSMPTALLFSPEDYKLLMQGELEALNYHMTGERSTP